MADDGPTTNMVAMLLAHGYAHPRKLPTGEWAALQQMMFTTALMVGLDECGYRTRFCYEDPAEAEKALAAWDGNGWPPGYWVKQKPENISNPNAAGANDVMPLGHGTNVSIWGADFSNSSPPTRTPAEICEDIKQALKVPHV